LGWARVGAARRRHATLKLYWHEDKELDVLHPPPRISVLGLLR
jgi:hypothetical protein